MDIVLIFVANYMEDIVDPTMTANPETTQRREKLRKIRWELRQRGSLRPIYVSSNQPTEPIMICGTKNRATNWEGRQHTFLPRNSPSSSRLSGSSHQRVGRFVKIGGGKHGEGKWYYKH